MKEHSDIGSTWKLQRALKDLVLEQQIGFFGHCLDITGFWVQLSKGQNSALRIWAEFTSMWRVYQNAMYDKYELSMSEEGFDLTLRTWRSEKDLFFSSAL